MVQSVSVCLSPFHSDQASLEQVYVGGVGGGGVRVRVSDDPNSSRLVSEGVVSGPTEFAGGSSSGVATSDGST